MASITLKDYLASLSTKGSISDGDKLPLLDSDSSNAIKTITKGTLVTLSDIDGFTEFSQSLRADIDTTLQVSASSEVTSVETRADIIGLQTYTSSLKQAIQVSGTNVQIVGELRANQFYVNYITSSVSLLTGSNEFGDTLADRHTFIGDVYINGEGPIGLLQLNAQTASQQDVNFGLGEVTGAFAIELGSVDSHILGVAQQTASQGLINTGISAVTGAFATELGDLQSNVTDFTNVLSGVSAVSGAIVTELAGIQNNITSFNGVFSGVSAVTGAFATELGQLQTQNTSQAGVNTGLSAVTGAFATELNGIQGDITTAENNISSFNSVFSGVSFVTAAFANELSDIQTQLTSQGGVNTGISAVTGAFSTELGGIQTQLTNRRGELNGLEAYTASLKSVGLISSSAQIAVEISGSGFTSASAEFAELTLTRGDGTTAQVDLSPRKVLELVKNKESQTLVKGTPVYVSGSTGNASHIYAASASRADRMPAAYVLNQDLAFDAEGYGIVVGFINGVNTSGFNEGDNVYVGESGGYTNVKPTGNSNRIQKLGNVIKVDAVNGSGVITGAGRSNDVPNIQEGYMWVGNASDVATQFTTSSVLGYGHDATFNTITASRLQLEDGTSNNILIGGTNGHILDPSSGFSNIFIGEAAGDALTTGDANIGIGSFALSSISDDASDGNVAIGLSAGNSLDSGSYNVMIGQNAMYYADNSDYSVAIGYEALRDSNNDYNVGIGFRTGYKAGGNFTGVGREVGYGLTSTATNNTGVGNRALGAGTTVNTGNGDFNTAVGALSLHNLRNGIENTAVGNGALYNVQDYSYNSAFGDEAGYFITTGQQNTVIGRWAGRSITTGIRNTTLGISAGNTIVSGSGNTVLGAHAYTQNSDDYNSIVIGSGSLGNGSNTVVIGNDDVTDTYLKGNVSGSSFHISETATLVSQNPLPTGVAGMLAVSASASNEKLYFYDGSSWREVSLV